MTFVNKQSKIVQSVLQEEQMLHILTAAILQQDCTRRLCQCPHFTAHYLNRHFLFDSDRETCRESTAHLRLSKSDVLTRENKAG